MIIISVYKIAQLNFFVKSFFRISGKFFRICSPNRILQLPKRKQGVEHLQQGVGGEPFGQLQPVEQLLPPLRRPRPGVLYTEYLGSGWYAGYACLGWG